MNEPQLQQEFVLRRLSETSQFAGRDVDGSLWMAVLIPVMVIGFIYVFWMYARDSRTLSWPFAVILGWLRMLVYCVLAGVFLLPAWQTWETTQKRSRVILLADVSPSMSERSDDLPPEDGSPAKLLTRLDKVAAFLADSKIAFLSKLAEKNPVYVYRFGAALDEEPAIFAKDHRAWDLDRWQRWLHLDAKQWFLDQFDEGTANAIAKFPAFDRDKPGSPEWAASFAKLPAAENVPGGLADAERDKYLSVLNRLDKRIESVRQLRLGTDVGESVAQALQREGANLPQGIILLTDGRTTKGGEVPLAEVRARASRERVPVFSVMVGEDRPPVEIRIADVQTPEQTPPNEKFVVRAELEGVGLPEHETTVFCDIYAPKAESPTHTMETKITFQSAVPPTAQAEFALDPESATPLPAELLVAGKKEFAEGEWRFVIRVPHDKREAFAAKVHVSAPVTVQVIKKPLRVLLVASGPTHDYQFLRTLLVREKDQQRAELSVFLQNEGRDGRAVQDVEPERLLSAFPNTLRVEDDPEEKPEARYANLGRYDVVVMYDPDWSEFGGDQLDLLKKWVDTQAGGLILVAGPVNTFQLARGEEGGRLKPILDLFPVTPGDSVLVAGVERRNPRTPFRLNFAGASPDMDFLKLDDESKEPISGWKEFFDGKDGKSDGQPLRGFYGFYPVTGVKAGASVVATFADPAARMNDGKEHPFLVTMPYGKGRVVFLGSSEMRRLRQFREVFYERFWMKLARWSAAGGRSRQNRRGVLVMGRDFSAGGNVRVEAQLFGPTLEPLPRSSRAKLIITAAEGSQRKEIELGPKPTAGDWAGWFQARFAAGKPGEYSVELPIPNSGDVLRGKFTVKASDPELDNTRPDPAALLQLAGDFKDVEDRIADAKDREAVRGKLRSASSGAGESPRLFFDLAGADVIPLCMSTQRKEQRNRGPVDDIWDDGPILGHTAEGKPREISAVLLVVVGLLCLEWIGRKLLRLA